MWNNRWRLVIVIREEIGTWRSLFATSTSDQCSEYYVALTMLYLGILKSVILGKPVIDFEKPILNRLSDFLTYIKIYIYSVYCVLMVMYCRVQRQIDRRQLEVIFGLSTRQQVKFRERHRRSLSGVYSCRLNKRWTTAAFQQSSHPHHMSESGEWGRMDASMAEYASDWTLGEWLAEECSHVGIGTERQTSGWRDIRTETWTDHSRIQCHKQANHTHTNPDKPTNRHRLTRTKE